MADSFSAPTYPNFGHTVAGGFDQDPNEEKKAAVFVHGWKMEEDRARLYAETKYKRLYQQGFKGRFAFFRWPTLVTDYSFSESELRAYKYGASLKSYINSLPADYARTVIAHSLGNCLVAGGLKRGMALDNYLAMQAAIPADCFDGSASIDPFFASEPSSDDADPAMGYKNYLTNVSADIVNYYNKSDFALNSGETSLFFFDVATNWRVWQKDHKPRYYELKGGFSLNETLRYGWSADNPIGQKVFLNKEHAPLFSSRDYIVRNVTEKEEAMAMIACPDSAAFGAETVGGDLIENIDLGDVDYVGFGNTVSDHSGQFNRPLQDVSELYSDINTDL